MSIKVICIDASPGKAFSPIFKEGDKLTASEVKDYNKEYYYALMSIGLNPDDSYIIEEYPFGPPNIGKGNSLCAWAKSRFAPISEIDETEFERNYQKELV